MKFVYHDMGEDSELIYSESPVGFVFVFYQMLEDGEVNPEQYRFDFVCCL